MLAGVTAREQAFEKKPMKLNFLTT